MQHAFSAAGSLCRWSTTRSSISGGRERDIVAECRVSNFKFLEVDPDQPDNRRRPAAALLDPTSPPETDSSAGFDITTTVQSYCSVSWDAGTASPEISIDCIAVYTRGGGAFFFGFVQEAPPASKLLFYSPPIDIRRSVLEDPAVGENVRIGIQPSSRHPFP